MKHPVYRLTIGYQNSRNHLIQLQLNTRRNMTRQVNEENTNQRPHTAIHEAGEDTVRVVHVIKMIYHKQSTLCATPAVYGAGIRNANVPPWFKF